MLCFSAQYLMRGVSVSERGTQNGSVLLDGRSGDTLSVGRLDDAVLERVVSQPRCF